MKRLASVLLSFFLTVLFLSSSLLLTSPALADDDSGHHHHEDLTEAQLGTVVFPVSCSANVQKAFQRGWALLHSFWYEAREKEFLQIAKADPLCPLAHCRVPMCYW